MNEKEVAEMLNGRQYLSEITDKEKEILKQNKLVVVFGESDDLVVFEGAIEDDFDCFNGRAVYLNEQGAYVDVENPENYRKIEVIWAENGYSWTYKTDIPHETFEIFEDRSRYCKGIVFSLNDLKRRKINEKEVIEIFYTFFNENKRPSTKTAENYVHNAVRYVESLLRDDVDKNAEAVQFYAATKANEQYCSDFYPLNNVEGFGETVTLPQYSHSQRLSAECMNVFIKNFCKTGKCIECGEDTLVKDLYNGMCCGCCQKMCI